MAEQSPEPGIVVISDDGSEHPISMCSVSNKIPSLYRIVHTC